jgi:selenium metabolism protein YedF
MKRAIIINSEVLGAGPDELGRRLMSSFLRKVCMAKEKPDTIAFYNSGVKLLCKGSSVLDSLDYLFQAGVELVGCGTCVAYFGLRNQIVVGRVSDMQEIVSIVTDADSAVTV